MLIRNLVWVLLVVAVCQPSVSSDAQQSLSHDIDNAQLHRFDIVSEHTIEHGKRLSAVLGCIGCHNQELTGVDWSEPELGVLWTANLTYSAHDYTEAELAQMITEGRRPDRVLMDMPSFLFSHLHPTDISAMVKYLKTLTPNNERRPEPTIGPQLQRDIEAGRFQDSAQQVTLKRDVYPPDAGISHEFGRLIARATCAECHGMDLKGSQEPLAEAPARPNLVMVLAYTRDEFAHFMRTGEAVGGRELTLMSSVARRRYAQFTENEIHALYDYLVAVARADH